MKKSLDQAKSYVLSTQFRSAEELETLAQAIRSGQSMPFSTQELELAMSIGNWNAAVSVSFLVFAVLLGLLLGVVVADGSGSVITLIGVAVVFVGLIAFRLTAFVDRKVAVRRLTADRTDAS